MKSDKPASIDAYITDFPEAVQEILQSVRDAISKAAPDATESISYAIPTFSFNGKHIVHFAAFKSHIGFYATPTGHSAFEKELSKYKQGKGSVQFPLNEAMPLSLISKITKFRLKEVKELIKAKGKK